MKSLSGLLSPEKTFNMDFFTRKDISNGVTLIRCNLTDTLCLVILKTSGMTQDTEYYFAEDILESHLPSTSYCILISNKGHTHNQYGSLAIR